MACASVILLIIVASKCYKRVDVISIIEAEYIGKFGNNIRKRFDDIPIPDIPNVELPGVTFTTPKRRRRKKIIRKTRQILQNFYYLWNQSF